MHTWALPKSPRPLQRAEDLGDLGPAHLGPAPLLLGPSRTHACRMATPDVTLSEVMSAQVLTIEVGESLWDAWQLLFVSGLRHICVLDIDGAFVGLLSDRMILANAPLSSESLSARTVGELLSSMPSTWLSPEASPVEAARLMAERSLEAVAVLDSRNKVVGIVTEADLVRWLLAA